MDKIYVELAKIMQEGHAYKGDPTDIINLGFAERKKDGSIK